MGHNRAEVDFSTPATMAPEIRSTSIGRSVLGVLCATLASLAVLPVYIVLATTDVPPEEGDSWVRGAIGLILLAPVLAGLLGAYYVVAAIVIHFVSRRRLAALVALGVVASGAFAGWAALRESGHYDTLVTVSLLVLADLLLGSGVLYYVSGRRRTPAAR
jgi:hypothetical protein